MQPSYSPEARAFFKAIAPPPAMLISEHAEATRMLAKRSSSRPGKWRNSVTPYLTEIMDRAHPSDPVQFISIQKGGQVGVSAAMENVCNYYMQNDPSQILYVLPTIDTAEMFAKEKLIPLMEDTPTLSEIMSRGERKSLRYHQYPGGALVVGGANSAASLKSISSRLLVLDERDNFPIDVDGQGDPAKIATVRTNSYAMSRKVIELSTPSRYAGESPIEKAVALGDRRLFMVPCPFCCVFQPLEWARIKWQKGNPLDAGLECSDCSRLIQHHRKAEMMIDGHWEATQESSDPRRTSYFLPAFYSPTISWGVIASEFVEANGDPAELKIVVNQHFGETWNNTDGEKLEAHEMLERRTLDGGPVPAAVGLITAAVDVQTDRLESQIVGWAEGEESFDLGYHVVHGDPDDPAVWAEMMEWITQPLPHELGIDAYVTALCVDTGGDKTDAAYTFCMDHKRTHRPIVWGIKGASELGSSSVKKPIWPAIASKTKNKNLKIRLLGTLSAKETVYARMEREDPGPGFMHFQMDRDVAYFEQLTAERRVLKYRNGRKRIVWEKSKSQPNEVFDLWCYNLAALRGCKAEHKYTPTTERARLQQAADASRTSWTPPPKRAPKRAAGGWLSPKRGHWL